MKRIINGVAYNTDTASKLGMLKSIGPNDERVSGTLYQTRGGAFFVHEKATRSIWNEREKAFQDKVEHTFTPLNQERARSWLTDTGVKVFHNPFASPPEDAEPETGATIYFRVPAPLKRLVDGEAKAEKLSANAWIMRCVEKCLEAPDVRGFQALARIWHIATTIRSVREDGQWSRETLIDALCQIADLSEEVAKQLFGKECDVTELYDALDEFERNDINKEFDPYPVE